MSETTYPTPQQNAEAALGWPLYNDGWQHPEGRVDELEGEMAHIALASLERFITFREKQAHIASMLGQEISDEEKNTFRLDQAGSLLLNKELRSERKNLQILHGLTAYAHDMASGEKVTELRGYQEDVVVDRLFKFANGRRAEGDLRKSCSFILPTGTGKTATFIHISEAVKYREDANDPVRVLVIEPSVDLTEQTRKAYNRFTPDLDVGVYRGGKKQLGREVVSITRESFNRLIERGQLSKDDFDVVIVDEIQEMLNDRTQNNIKEYCRNKLLIGTTATPDRNELVSARELFPPIYEMYMRDAIDRKLLAPSAAATVKAPVTDEVYQAARNKLGAELFDALPVRLTWHFVQREASMQTGEKFTKALVEDGRQTLVRCKGGRDMYEAGEMMRRLNGKEIFDRRLGKQRNMVAQMITGKMSTEEREGHYDQFNAGKIDVLIHVRVLGMGWDGPRAKGYVDLAPNRSLSDATQNYGRLTRPYENEDNEEVAAFGVTVYDETALSGFVTFSDVLEETVNDPDKVVGAGSEGEQSRVQSIHFTDSLRSLLDELKNHTVADIVANAGDSSMLDSMLAQEYIERRSKQLMPLAQTLALLRLETKDLNTVMKNKGLRFKRSRTNEREYYVTLGDLRELIADNDLDRSFMQLPESGYFLVEEVAKNLEITPRELRVYFQDKRVPLQPFVDEFGFPGQYVSIEEYRKLAKTYRKEQSLLSSYNDDFDDEE